MRAAALVHDPMTATERREALEELWRTCREIRREEREFAAVKKCHKERLDELEETKGDLLHRLSVDMED